MQCIQCLTGWRPHRDRRRVGVVGLFRTRRTSVDQPNQGSPSSREPFRCTSTARAIPANGEKSRSEESPASLRREASPSTFCGLFANVVAGQQRELAAGWRDSGGGTRRLIVRFECPSAAYMRPDRYALPLVRTSAHSTPGGSFLDRGLLELSSKRYCRNPMGYEPARARSGGLPRGVLRLGSPR
jgi:hypothetical protein